MLNCNIDDVFNCTYLNYSQINSALMGYVDYVKYQKFYDEKNRFKGSWLYK